MPRLSRLISAALLLLAPLVGGCAAPLADTPYRRLAASGIGPGPHLIRVEALPAEPAEAVVSPGEPHPEMVREAACEALQGTPFVCADPRDPRARPEYVMHVIYHVRDARPRSPGMDFLRMMGSGGRVFGDHDPPQDAGHEIVWRFDVARAAGAEPVFRSHAFTERLQYWRFDMTHWLARHFSE